MSPSELPRLLSELEQSGARLNAESDSINSTIEAIEQRIAKANIGFEIWLEGNEALDREDGVAFDEEKQCEVSYRAETQLGYAKLEGPLGWCIAVRTCSYYLDGSRHESRNYRQPLLKTARNTRLSAVAKIPTLIKELRRAADEAVSAISEAKKLVVD